MLIIITLFVINACIAGTIPAAPENITVTFLTPSSVRVSWQTMLNLQTHPIEKYVVTYKPTDDRVVQQVAGNSEAVILDRLSPSTQYSIAVTAIWLGKKYRSRQIVFRTLDLPRNLPHQQDTGMPPGHQMGIFTDEILSIGSNVTNSTTRELPPIRGVEVGIVLLVLMVWAGAIALFFNRWGKIRMLLPYQPDYKHEQLKVPGTGVCTGGSCTGAHSHQFEGSDGTVVSPSKQKLRHFHYLQEEPSVTIADRCSRSRINSAIFVSSEGRGFDSIEFLRRHGSQSVLCRKARSAENISDENRKTQFSENRQWYTEDETNGSNAKNSNNQNHQINNETIELAECYAAPLLNSTTITTTIPVASTSSGGGCGGIGGSYGGTIAAPTIVTTSHLATVTTANTIVVGSISIETPPSHIRQQEREQQEALLIQLQAPKQKHEFKKQQTQQQQIEKVILKNSPKLTHQQSSSSSTTSHSQSPNRSPNHSPVPLCFKHSTLSSASAAVTVATAAAIATVPKITTLPTLSVSEPSPPHDGDFL